MTRCFRLLLAGSILCSLTLPVAAQVQEPPPVNIRTENDSSTSTRRNRRNRRAPAAPTVAPAPAATPAVSRPTPGMAALTVALESGSIAPGGSVTVSCQAVTPLYTRLYWVDRSSRVTPVLRPADGRDGPDNVVSPGNKVTRRTTIVPDASNQLTLVAIGSRKPFDFSKSLAGAVFLASSTVSLSGTPTPPTARQLRRAIEGFERPMAAPAAAPVVAPAPTPPPEQPAKVAVVSQAELDRQDLRSLTRLGISNRYRFNNPLSATEIELRIIGDQNTYHAGDNIQLECLSNKDAYVQIYHADGAGNVNLVFPANGATGQVKANTPATLVGKVAATGGGFQQFIALATDVPVAGSRLWVDRLPVMRSAAYTETERRGTAPAANVRLYKAWLQVSKLLGQRSSNRNWSGSGAPLGRMSGVNWAGVSFSVAKAPVLTELGAADGPPIPGDDGVVSIKPSTRAPITKANNDWIKFIFFPAAVVAGVLIGRLMRGKRVK